MKTLFLALTLAVLLAGCKTNAVPATDNSTQPKVEETMKKSMPEGQLTYVTYSFQGMAMEMVRNMELQRVDGKAQLSFDFWQDKRQYAVDDSLLTAARKIIEEEEMYNYDTSYSPNFDGRILDGYSWSFDAKFEGGERISSHGRNAEPSGNGLQRMYKLLRDAAMKELKDHGELEKDQ